MNARAAHPRGTKLSDERLQDMASLALILLVAAFVLFLLDAIGVPSGRVNLVAAGLACWVLSLLVGGTHLLH